jgi:alkylation response protein AidB-like acyl-CoA dehydrogenase
MFIVDEMSPPKLGLTGLEPDLSEQERSIQDTVHRFAKEVMRPVGEQLDKMPPAEVVATGSPMWSYLEQLEAAGIVDLATLASMEPAQKARLLPLLFEELGWGDSGLAILSLVTSFPAYAAYLSGDAELAERFGGTLGSWVGTQPDRGSDIVDWDTTEVYPTARQGRGNLLARMDGDSVILNGQTSAWVSGAPIAETGLVFCQCDYGDGVYNEAGGLHMIAMLVPFDEGGVSKGEPLDKLGQRPLPQGEIFFDDVKVPKKYVLAGQDSSSPMLFGTLTFANMEMGFTFCGVARAALEHALDYVSERRQGGVELIQHQSMKIRIFDMWRKLESARAMAQRAAQYNYSSHGPHLLASVTSKTLVTQTAFEVASEAVQIFGGNGLSKEYPVEKLMRDARAAMIEDGENTILSLKGATWLSRAHGANA